MAPTTRSKASSNAGSVPAVTPAPPTKAAGGKAKKAKTPKRPAATTTTTKPEATASKVQKKKKKSSPKNKKQKGKSKDSRHSSTETSLKSSSSKSSSRSSLTPSSPKKPTTTTTTSKTPRPAAHPSAQRDDFPELAQAISILPYLDQDTLLHPPSTPRTPLPPRTDHVLRPNHDVLMTQLAHHMVNPPAWSTSRPGTGHSSKISANNKIGGFGRYLPRGFELAESPPPTASAASQRDRSSGNASPHVHVRGPVLFDGRRREPSARSSSSVVRDIVTQGESQGSETPVSFKNAHVFKRPTVADVRRERTLMHDKLRDWTRRLRRARDELDAVIEEIESRMQIIRAVNRMQAPLKKAPLGRGR